MLWQTILKIREIFHKHRREQKRLRRQQKQLRAHTRACLHLNDRLLSDMHGMTRREFRHYMARNKKERPRF